MLNLTAITCPDDCSDVNLLPAIVAEQDCTGYEQTLSQVCDLYILPSATDDIFADWATTPTNVTPDTGVGIDNTNTDNTKSKWLVGIGELPASEKTTTEYPLAKSKTTDRLYTLTFRILNLSAAQYTFLRQLQCGTLGFTFWYGDLGSWLYGLSGGIVPDFVTVTFPKGEGNTDKNVGIIRLSWKADGDPERRVNPLA